MTDLQQSLSSLQVQDAQEGTIMHTLPLSPPVESQTTPETTTPLLPDVSQPLPVSPSQVLPTPPPSSESSPMVPLSGRGTDHMTTAEATGGCTPKFNLRGLLVTRKPFTCCRRILAALDVMVFFVITTVYL